MVQARLLRLWGSGRFACLYSLAPKGSSLFSSNINQNCCFRAELPLPRCTAKCLCISFAFSRAATMSYFHPGISLLPVDPSLANGGELAPLLSATARSIASSFNTPTVVVTEGIPPVSRQLMEKIQRWEFINLGDLFT